MNHMGAFIAQMYISTHKLCLKDARLCKDTLVKYQVTGIYTANHHCIVPCSHDEFADILNCADTDQEAVGMYHLAKVAQPEL